MHEADWVNMGLKAFFFIQKHTSTSSEIKSQTLASGMIILADDCLLLLLIIIKIFQYPHTQSLLTDLDTISC